MSDTSFVLRDAGDVCVLIYSFVWLIIENLDDSAARSLQKMGYKGISTQLSINYGDLVYLEC